MEEHDHHGRGAGAYGWGAVCLMAALVVPGAVKQSASVYAATPPGHARTAQVQRLRVCAHPTTLLVDDRSGLTFIACQQVFTEGNGWGTVQVWDTRTLRLRHTFPLAQYYNVSGMAVDARHGRLWLGGDFTLKLYDLRTFAVLRTITGRQWAVVDEADSRVFDGLHVLDPRTGRILGVYARPPWKWCVLSTRQRRMYCLGNASSSDRITVLDPAAPPGPRMRVADLPFGATTNVVVDERNNHLLVLGLAYVVGPARCSTRAPMLRWASLPVAIRGRTYRSSTRGQIACS